MNIAVKQYSDEDLRTEKVPDCLICGLEGTTLHPELRDHVFGAPGTWRMVACQKCGVAWLNPRLTTTDIGKAYATYYTHTDQEAGNVFRAVLPSAGRIERARRCIAKWLGDAAERIRARRLEYAAPASSAGVALLSSLAERVPVFRDSAVLAVAELTPGNGRRLLDVGCGGGEFLRRMMDRGWSVVGVEPDPVAAEGARRNGLDVRDGLLVDANFAADTFDAITLSHVIEHVHDPIALLGECGRVLAPGGTLVIMTPNLASVGHRWFGADWRGLEPPRHLHVFSVEALSACVLRAGLAVSRVRTSARLVRGIWWVSRVIQYGAGNRKSAPGLGSYLESYGMTLVEDLMRGSAPLSSEEIVLMATKAPAPRAGV